MPNAANIERPIVLIGAGRSGTSLVSRVFDLHPDCATVGETVNLIFGPWNAVAESSSSIVPLIEGDRWVPEDVRAGRVVRETFLTCFPDTKRFWMQKPIGVPMALSERFAKEPDVACSPAAGAWYWRVMRSSFPDARFIGILRHPCDVVLSARSKWGFTEGSFWGSLAAIAGFLTHADSPVSHVVRYEQLVAAPEATVRALCEAIGVPFAPEMLAAFDEIHVPAPGREDPSRSGYSRREEWATLDPAQLGDVHRDAIAGAFERFGGAVEWPPHFQSGSFAAADEASQPRTESELLRVQIGQLGARLERAMFNHAEQLRRRDDAWQQREHEFFASLQAREQAFAAREQELTRLWTEQKVWIEELERVQGWLQQQVEHWRELAQKRG